MASESNRRNNRIEVDLKVLKDAEMDLLTAFSGEFARSVKSLSTTLANYATQLKAHGQNVTEQMVSGIGTSGLTGGSIAGPTVAAGPHIMTPAEKAAAFKASTQSQFNASTRAGGGGGDDGGGGRGSYGNDQDKIDANRAKIADLFATGVRTRSGIAGRASGAIQGNSYATAGLNMVERTQFSMGSFGEPSIAQGLSMGSNIFGNLALRGHVDKETGLINDGAKLTTSQRAFARYSNRLGTAARVKIGFDNTVAPLARSVSNFSTSQRMGAAEQMGYDAGGDSWGGLRAMPGINLTTEGGRRELAMNWTDRIASTSLGWSGKQAASVGEALRGRGIDYGKDWKWNDWNGGETRGSRLGEQMQSISRSTGMDVGAISEFQSRAMKYDPTSLSSLPDDMNALAKSAKAAGMSVDEMAKSALAASASLIESTGMSTSDANRAITAGNVMGLQPEQTARLQNRDLTLRTLASERASGGKKQYSELLRDPSKNLQQTMKEVQAVSGVDMKLMRQLRKKQYTDKSGKSSQQYEAMRSQLDILYQDPATRETIFQGMTPDQLLEASDSTEIARGGLSGALRESLDSYNANDGGAGFGQLSRADFKKQLKASGVKAGSDDWKKIFDEKGRKKEWKMAQDVLGRKGAADTNNVKVEVTFTGKAEKMLKEAGGKDKVSERNTKGYSGDSQPFRLF